MPSPRQNFWLSLSVGVLLLATAIFYPVGQWDPNYSYEVTEVTLSDGLTPGEKSMVGWHIHDSPAIVECGVDSSRSCYLEHRIRAAGGTFVLNESEFEGDWNRFPATYQYVYFYERGPNMGTFYRPVTESQPNGSVELGLESVALEAVVANTTIDGNRTTRSFRQLLETGSYRSTEPLGDWEWWEKRPGVLVAYHGSYYSMDGFHYRSGPKEEILRGGLLLAGVVLVLTAGRTWT